MNVNKYNRELKTQPKLGKFWCGACDAQIMTIGQKCPNCKSKHHSKKRKKY